MKHENLQMMLARRYELSASDETLVYTHLQQCAECRFLEAEYRTQDTALRPLALDAAPSSLRASVLSAVATQHQPERRQWWMPVGALAAACLIVAGGFGLTGWPLSSSGGLGPPMARADAIRAALVHTVAAPYRNLPPTIKVSARLGPYPGVARAWMVTISGPGVSVLPPQTSFGVPQAPPAATLHKETAVIDGQTGVYVETVTDPN